MKIKINVGEVERLLSLMSPPELRALGIDVEIELPKPEPEFRIRHNPDVFFANRNFLCLLVAKACAQFLAPHARPGLDQIAKFVDSAKTELEKHWGE
jgi:hypothetical protein